MTQTSDQQWFIVHHDEAPWSGIPGHAYVDLAKRAGAGSFTQYGIAVDVFEPGNGACYHRELHDDESFLVLDGEFDLVVEGELHRIRAGELVHCPAGTAHVFVGAGDRPASIVMLGARGNVPDGGTWGEYVPEPHSLQLGCGVDEPTSDPKVAYAGRPAYGPVDAPQTFRIDRTPRETTSIRRGSTTPWVIVDVDDVYWADNGEHWCMPGDAYGDFPQYGLNVRVLRPGVASAAYHRELLADETLLVLDGTGILVVEGEEHPIRAGDFIHLPVGTAHVTVGGTGAPCVILMLGSRVDHDADEDSLEYPAEPAAARHGASVAEHTRDPDVAYADAAPFEHGVRPEWRWH